MLMQQKPDLGQRHRAVDASPGGQIAGARPAEDLELSQARVLFLQGGRGVVAQSTVDRREARIERRAAEVGGNHRELSQDVGHVLVLEPGEPLVGAVAHAHRLGRGAGPRR